MTARARAPLASPSRILRLDPAGVSTATVVAPDEACFAGHFPGQPILPGVLLLELVERAVEQWSQQQLGRSARWGAIGSVRFSAPVGPGDEVLVDCSVTRRGEVLDVRARCHGGDRRVAGIRGECVPQ